MPDRSLTYSRAGAPHRPAQPAWFHRLDEILGALRSMTSPHLDRAAVEKLFRVRQRTAQAGARACGDPPTWWREALSDRHGRGPRQRVAGALRRHERIKMPLRSFLNVKNPMTEESPRYPISTESYSGFVEAPFLGRMESVGRPSRYSPPVRERQQRSLQICTSLGEG